jgi:hypothetical protein
MPTTTRTSAQLLAFAIKEFGDADALVKRRTKDVENARERASATSGLVAAAERAFNNADAHYRLLYEKAESAAAEALPSAAEVANCREVLRQAEAVRTALEHSYNALGKAVEAASKCLEGAEGAEGSLSASVETLERPATDEERKSPLSFPRNLAKPLHAPRTELRRGLRTLRANCQRAQNELRDAPPLPDLTSLREEVRKLDDDRKPGAAPAVSKTDLDKLQADRDAAELDWRQAPEIERTAQADLQAKETALTEAKKFLDAATAGRDEAEDNFIERVDVGRPSADGIVEARVIFVNGGPPEGYGVRWIVEAGELVDPMGTVVQIKTQGVPDGNYAIEAHLERA